jgi:sugar-specific transcriptional regulator TrmB
LHKEGISIVKQEDMSTALHGRSNIYSHLREILENSSKEAILCMPADELEARPRVFAPLFDRLNKSGVKLKVALKGDEKDIKRINEKFKIKALKSDIDSRFFISDGKEIIFMLAPNSPNDNNDIAIWLNSDFFASALVSMFNLAFKK